MGTAMIHIHDGQCDCGQTRYRIHDQPLIVHGCHCRACQRQTGSTNAVNALIERHKVELVSGEKMDYEVATPSGAGQLITRCIHCKTAMWSEYRIFTKWQKASILFIRAGTLDHPEAFPPDVHIFTATKQPHLILSDGTPAFAEFYNIDEVWSQQSRARLRDVQGTGDSFAFV